VARIPGSFPQEGAVSPALARNHVLLAPRAAGRSRGRASFSAPGARFSPAASRSAKGAGGWQTDMSSSIASQWIPSPPPMSSQPALCRGVASINRGNQARGAETVRPSARTTQRVSSVQDTSTACASLFSAKVRTLDNAGTVLEYACKCSWSSRGIRAAGTPVRQFFRGSELSERRVICVEVSLARPEQGGGQ